jgi:hypothetical protein
VPPIVTNQQSNLISSAHQADMIMIVPQAWMEALEPLAQARRAEGLTVAMVAIEDVYDTFSFGDVDPQAIREFLELAYSTWTRPAPAYVLLAGDGHYDPQDRLGTGNPSFMPVHMLQTFNLFAASDNYFAAVAGSDSLPDMAIGRLPARSADELASMVSKILAYESMGAPAVPTATIATDPGFTDQVTQVVSTFPGVLQIVSTQSLPLASVREAVRDAFAAGDSHVAFYGHGSITQWGQGAGILKVADLATLPMGSPAVVAAYNCLSGYFQHPSVQGLGEELIRINSGGAVAVFAPTATTGSGSDLRAIERFVENAYSIGYRRAGDILTKVKIDLIGTSTFSEDFVRTWTLIGDPAMKIQR